MRYSAKALLEAAGDLGARDLREMGRIAGRAPRAPMGRAVWESFGATAEQAAGLEFWSAMRGEREDFEEMAAGMEAAKVARVYRAREGSALERELAPGSALVGIPREDGSALVYCEGNVYGAENLKEFGERAACAAGRLFARYPTTALANLSAERAAEELVEVGTIDSYAWRFRPEAPAGRPKAKP